MPVQLFKEKIASEIGIPVNQQRLIFRGRVLKDEHALSDYRILSISAFNICFILTYFVVFFFSSSITSPSFLSCKLLCHIFRVCSLAS